jgi:ACS family tartrate transporter-like MFS transporter
MALVEGPMSFWVLRFLLGMAEAGFFPAVILYLTFWFPSRYRARIISTFMLSIPISLAIGAPLSTWLLQMDGIWGLKGWQWLFIIEGIPGMLLVGVVLKYLPDSPKHAAWLTDDEREWLTTELENDAKAHPVQLDSAASLWKVFFNPAIIALCLIYFCATATNLGLSMFLPQILKQQGLEGMEIGFVAALPYLVGIFGMISIGYLSDHFRKRKTFLIFALLLIAGGLASAGWMSGSTMAIVAMCVATIGIMGCKGPFWPLPSLYLSGTSAAAGIALINSVGNMGGFFGPGIVGMAKEMTGNFESGLYALSGMALFAILLAVFLVSDKGRAQKKSNASDGIAVAPDAIKTRG